MEPGRLFWTIGGAHINYHSLHLNIYRRYKLFVWNLWRHSLMYAMLIFEYWVPMIACTRLDHERRFDRSVGSMRDLEQGRFRLPSFVYTCFVVETNNKAGSPWDGEEMSQCLANERGVWTITSRHGMHTHAFNSPLISSCDS
jgi:hypothetical protein